MDHHLFSETDIDDDREKQRRCRSCKRILNALTDRKKTRDGWWTNCQCCRDKHTAEWRQKRDSGTLKLSKSRSTPKPTHSAVTEKAWPEKKTEGVRCAECDRRPHKPWRTSCGHLLCDLCYGNVLDAAVEAVQTNGTCKACGQHFFACTPCGDEETASRVKPATKRRREQDSHDCGNESDEHGDSKTAKSAAKMMECSVCGETGPANNHPQLSACTHKPDVCNKCFLEWLESQLDSTSWEKIQCPSNGCDQSITHADVKLYASDDLFIRFDELFMRAFLSNDPNFRYCLAAGCPSGQIHDTGTDGNIFRCNACNFRVCTVHDVPFHTGTTCAQYDERLRREEEQRRREDDEREEQNEASRAEIVRSTTRCPGCDVPIHKYKDCDHMTCSRCRFQFCYICRAPYQGKDGIWSAGNKVHAADCQYHPNMLPDYQSPAVGQDAELDTAMHAHVVSDDSGSELQFVGVFD